MPEEAPQDLTANMFRLRSFDLRNCAANGDAQDGLLAVPWVKELLQSQHLSPVLTAGAMLSKESELPADHMFSALLKVGLITDMLCVFSKEHKQYHTLITLGDNVCGHPKIVHGGLTAAIIDETLGGLNYVLKRQGVIGQGPAFTVHLEVDYKKPVPAGSHVICSAELDQLDGRKAWVRAQVLDRPSGNVYATGKALFVIPKQAAIDGSQQRQSEAHVERLAEQASQ